MKSKKTLMTLGVIVAVLVLGVGYAAITDINLNINGTAAATPSDDNFSVIFTGTPSTSGDTVSASITDDLTATMTVTGLTTTGDTATASYTIKNASEELSATVEQGTITNDNETYFEVTTDWTTTTLAADGSKTVTVTVKLIKTPIEDQSATFTIPFTATAVLAS